jgi:hypothetical protein
MFREILQLKRRKTMASHTVVPALAELGTRGSALVNKSMMVA